MGSTGSGSFTDYTKAKSIDGSTGGTSGEDKCQLSISCILEEVAQSTYYNTNQDVPPAGKTVLIQFMPPRIVAVDATSGKDCGALPTGYNYLLNCIENGYSYAGVVSNSSNGLNPIIEIDIRPITTP
ncbi:hypothetical protein NMT30_001502 [Vibrio cholerae]|uniref:hypothetical protein n=1 Tax=Vibrio TaxID=662 RepID=UPI000DE32F5E|nr:MULTISPECIES: hypothetical protein [Vibrio]EGQ7689798.1 hypothetical protein [Vibrio cholerae]EGQ7968837.1 hypothetical protein [Vibrio cholerae]EGR0364306.1 hypothetical protein [Vibrio cholerae]EGR0593280.1 hypothetical protein [Vibrio cholerae]EGR0661768.1 hypothetical protein [Vibrio cholerae]